MLYFSCYSYYHFCLESYFQVLIIPIDRYLYNLSYLLLLNQYMRIACLCPVENSEEERRR
jgi:hypothetical protein